MAQADRPQSAGTQHQHVSVNSRSIPVDLLQRLMSGSHFNHKPREEAEGDEIELSLGLSLNGKFGVDPRAKKLRRSSSIPDFINSSRKNGSAFVIPAASQNIARTCSLPAETEEEARKRKEMQTIRRMAAKRKRSEKQRNLKAVKDRNRGFGEEGCEEDKRNNGTIGNDPNYHREQLLKASGAGMELVRVPLSQGSIGSQGSGSSGISESECHLVQGMNQCADTRSPASAQMSECEQKLTVTPGSVSGSLRKLPTQDNKCSNFEVNDTKTKENVSGTSLEDMPCVSTRGDGPNGKIINGFLYKYGNGGEVRIVCVCHGSFLSPAEFVKHAGGGDVAHPLKHIVVNPSPLL
ncbi:hypothetical protein K2173_010099 [Erythroxylum novogranatense]|uniref:Ninja-family protein n=1 Tax=Erythroxylum novogranatense TaxID=1862640 RepID=A0AAV8SC22_9ROSI|nr:hypothetical protein K2173_010099 [Erythroxylum novogranatense]